MVELIADCDLEERLRALGHPNRFELLRLLRHVRTVEEIRLTPTTAGGRPERAISRQAVQNHLDQLVDLGLVQVQTVERPGRRPAKGYSINRAHLYAVVEDLRDLVRSPAIETPDVFDTLRLTPTKPPQWEDGPKLILVRGLAEGAAFPLRGGDLREGRGWVVGRAPDAQVRLDYDPHVSLENAEILRDANGYRLLDLRTATNGTFLNWQRLPTGGESRLRPGDVVGVGRSLLLFRPD